MVGVAVAEGDGYVDDGGEFVLLGDSFSEGVADGVVDGVELAGLAAVVS